MANIFNRIKIAYKKAEEDFKKNKSYQDAVDSAIGSSMGGVLADFAGGTSALTSKQLKLMKLAQKPIAGIKSAAERFAKRIGKSEGTISEENAIKRAAMNERASINKARGKVEIDNLGQEGHKLRGGHITKNIAGKQKDLEIDWVKGKKNAQATKERITDRRNIDSMRTQMNKMGKNGGYTGEKITNTSPISDYKESVIAKIRKVLKKKK